MDKKGINLLMENLVFILLVLVFISAMFFAVSRTGNQAILDEKVNANKIALIIDKAKPGMEIEIDIFDMKEIARKNKFSGNIITINNDLNNINVKLNNGNGYTVSYFNDVNVEWNLIDEKVNERCVNYLYCLKLEILESSDV